MVESDPEDDPDEHDQDLAAAGWLRHSHNVSRARAVVGKIGVSMFLVYNLRHVLRETRVGPEEKHPLFARSLQDATVWASIHDERRYSPGGVVPVSVRVSIVRLALFKLLGIGVAVAVSGIGAATPSLRRSCALAAGVNFVACCYYYMIMRVRSQGFGASPMRLDFGRTEDKYLHELAANANKLFAQEVVVDSLRHSDWLVTVGYAWSHTLPPPPSPTGALPCAARADGLGRCLDRRGPQPGGERYFWRSPLRRAGPGADCLARIGAALPAERPATRIKTATRSTVSTSSWGSRATWSHWESGLPRASTCTFASATAVGPAARTSTRCSL